MVWQAIARVARPQPIAALVPVLAGLFAAAANAAVARALRGPSRYDAAVRLAYAHNLGDTVVSLAPVAAGGLVLATGNPIFDSLVALIIAVAVVIPSMQTLMTSHRELLWPDDVACGPHVLEQVRARCQTESLLVTLTVRPGARIGVAMRAAGISRGG